MPSLLDLPDELLVQVIEDAVPTAMGSSKEYDERCRTLHAVALTSKRLHAVALPLLYRVLRVTEARFRPTLAACKGVDTPTYPLAKTLVCEGNAFGGLPADQLSFAVAATPGISDLRICYCKEFALIELQAMSGLASLTLHDVLHGTALTAQHVRSLHLPHLADLSLEYTVITQSGCKAFLSCTTFPSLRHLALGVVVLLDSHGPAEEVVPLTSLPLLAQLRTLRCWHASHPSSFSFPDTLRLLYNASVGVQEHGQPSYATLSRVPHLALRLRGKLFPHPEASRDRNRLANAKGALEEMTASLSRAAQGAGPSLRLVLLESDLLREDDALADKEAFAELKPAVEAFLEACKAVGVEVIVQETSQYGLESFVSERFIQWCEQKYGTE
ncbi:hypothetical protein JCM10213_005929 [Rhodosporidiobolus nylandii]